MISASISHLTHSEQKALTEFNHDLLEQFANLLEVVVLYGSKARGDDTSTSDIDILVVVNTDNWQIHK